MLPVILIALTSSYGVNAQKLSVYALSGTESSPGDKLLRCVRTFVREETESAKISTNGDCIPLPRSWLETRTIEPGFTYLTGKMKDLQFQPPMLVTTSSYKTDLPGLLRVGSSVDVSFSFPYSNITVYVLLSMDNGNEALKAVIDINKQKLKLDYRIDHIWQRDFITADIMLSVDTVYKLSIKPFENGTDVFLNDNLTVKYNNKNNPFTPENAQRVLFDTNPDTGKLHRLKIVAAT